MSPELVHALATVPPAQLGARLRAARLAAGMTQPQLAGADASVAYLSRIEGGQRRPGAPLLEKLADRLGVSVERLVVGADREEARRVELRLDHAELSLAGGEAANALTLAREALATAAIEAVPGGAARGRYVEAAALDALGDESAAAAYRNLLDSEPDSMTRIKAATALSRIWREQGQTERAIAGAEAVLASLPPEELASEEGIRLAVTLAAALHVAGRVVEAAELCDRAIAESERLSSPVARASAYWNASIIRANAGDVDAAIDMARRALQLLEDTERVRDLGRLRTQMVAIMLRSTEPPLAEARRQLQIARTELDWSEATPVDRARNALVQAQALFLSGEADDARRRARAVVDEVGEELPHICVQALALLGQVAWSSGDVDEAKAAYLQAITLLTEVGADREAGQLWFELGQLASEVGLTAEAADAFRRAAVSTGLSARLPVVPPPPSGHPRSTPSEVPSART